VRLTRASFIIWLMGAAILAKPAVCHLAFAGGAATEQFVELVIGKVD
jgi:hypothetical protein